MPASLALLPEPAVALDRRGAVLAASPPTVRMFRRDPVGSTIDQLVACPARLWEALEGVPPGALVPVVPLEGRRANGVPFALDVSVRVLDDGLLCVLREVDRQRPGTLDEAFDQMPLGMALFNTDGQYVRVNAALCGLLGRTADELIGMRDQELTHPDDRQSDIDAAWRVLNGELSTWQCEKRFVRSDGEIVWTFANLTFLRDEFGRPLCWVGQFQDITELRRMASRDPLTDALNRRAFDIELERSAASGRPGALLVLDLDGFKEINDAHGHHAGDELLRVTAAAIARRLRRGDVLARLGGDEFAVLLSGCEMDHATRVAVDIAELVGAQRFVFDGIERAVTTSVGLARVDAIDTPAQIISAADRAMYSAKAVGGGRVRGHNAL
jgi:diguanylate cyclase (GGDEF)-like protein/PAS domain S-box-containing protein